MRPHAVTVLSYPVNYKNVKKKKKQPNNLKLISSALNIFFFLFFFFTFAHPDGQHDVGVALQDLHRIAVSDVIKAHPISCKDLIPHFDAMLLCKSTWVQPEEQYEKIQT